MNAQNCLDILREIKDVAFATVNDEGKPEYTDVAKPGFR